MARAPRTWWSVAPIAIAAIVTAACDGGGAACEPLEEDAISGATGMAVARDGTVYYPHGGAIGRRSPDGTVEERWVTVDDARVLLGMAIDAPNEVLFVGAVDAGLVGAPTIYRVEITSGTATAIASGGLPYHVTSGPDGFVYYTDYDAHAVWRVDPRGATRTMVSVEPIMNPRGLAFEDDGALLVASAYPSGQVHRLLLGPDGVETAREAVGPALGATAIALDDAGRIYVSSEIDSLVARMDADGENAVTIASGLRAPFSLAFGHGVLCADDLYVVVELGIVRRIHVDAAGGAVPWH